MSDQHDGPLDKVKDAVGMGEDDEQETASLPDTPEDRADGWAGVDGALGGAPEGTVESGYGSGKLNSGRAETPKPSPSSQR